MRFRHKNNYYYCTFFSNLTNGILGIEFSSQDCVPIQVGVISGTLSCNTNDIVYICHELVIERVLLAVNEKCREYNIKLNVKSIQIHEKNLVSHSEEKGFYYGIAGLIVDRMQLFPNNYDGEWNGVDDPETLIAPVHIISSDLKILH